MNKTVFSCLLKVMGEGARSIMGLPLKRPLVLSLSDELFWLMGRPRGPFPVIFVPGQEHMPEIGEDSPGDLYVEPGKGKGRV